MFKPACRGLRGLKGRTNTVDRLKMDAAGADWLVIGFFFMYDLLLLQGRVEPH